MGALLPWRPFRDIERTFRDLERWTRRLPSFLEEWPSELREEYLPPVESFVENGNLVVRADVPGIEPKDINISVLGNVLTIKGERKEKKEIKEEDYIRREVSYGGFERRMTLPEGTDADKIKAQFKNGVVEITMPTKQVAAKKIPLEVEPKKIEK